MVFAMKGIDSISNILKGGCSFFKTSLIVTHSEKLGIHLLEFEDDCFLNDFTQM